MSLLSTPFSNQTAFGIKTFLPSTPTSRPRRNRPQRRQIAAPVEGFDPNFTAALVHEVRNPLSNIYLAIEMLQSEIIDDELKLYLDIIKRSARRINTVVSGLLNKCSLQNNIAEKYSIHHLLDEVLEAAKDSIGLKKIGVKKDYGKHDHYLQLDRMKMSIGLSNIVVNAVEAMEMGKGDLSVTTRSNEGAYIIEIADNGCGISRENLKNIFKPYYTNKPGGLGLGLASAYNILQSNHVNVKVESEEGEGTRFILSFEEMQ